MPSLADRFAAAPGPPLSDLSRADARELAELLASAVDLDDLPGRWQAALLRAEAGAEAAAPPGGCCHHGHGH